MQKQRFDLPILQVVQPPSSDNQESIDIATEGAYTGEGTAVNSGSLLVRVAFTINLTNPNNS